MSTPSPGDPPDSPLPEAYGRLVERHREIGYLRSSASLLGWDRETHMPGRAHAFRGEQLACLGGRAHRLATAPEVGDWLTACEEAGLSEGSEAAANVREWRRDHDRACRLPAAFVEAFERARNAATRAWEEARRADDFAPFTPHLARLVELAREKADRIGFAGERYDALLDEHEPGATAAGITALFAGLRAPLVEIAGLAAERARDVPADLLAGDYPRAQQARFNREVAAAFGFDFEAGRIDASRHPFCSGIGPGDTRMTTRYDPRDFTSSLFGVMHECGHGLYDQGLREEAWATPAGEAASLGIHESQSRLWENHVGRSPAFWEHWFERAAEHFPDLRKRTPADVARAVTRSAPSFIRVEADEATYDLHIVVRFDIERALVDGSLEPAGVESAWNRAFADLVGLEVRRPVDGALQDIHWSFGMFGYFPTYTLGNLAAAQLMAAARRGVPGLDDDLAGGRYDRLLAWLREHVHALGRTLAPDELVRRATGSPLTPDAHLAHLRSRYVGGAADRDA